MGETLSLISHLGLACIAVFILSQGRIHTWNAYGYLIYVVYGFTGVVTNVLNNDRTMSAIYRITHDVAYVFSPALFAMSVAIAIYRLQEDLAYILLIGPAFYILSFIVNINLGMIERLTQIVCVSIVMFCVLKEKYEGSIAGVLFLVACVMDNIRTALSAKDVSYVNGILIAASIFLWYAFGGQF